MRASSFLGLLATLFASSVDVSPAYGQWTAGFEVGADRYWGGSIEIGGEERSFRPYRPTTLGLGLARNGSPLGWGLQIHYSEACLGLEGPGAIAAVEGVFTVLSVSPELVYPLLTLGPVTELLLHAGPLVEVWGIIDEQTRTHLGAQGAVSLDIPITGRFAGTVVGGIAVTPSPFEAGQLGETFEPRTLWRRRFALGMQYRL